jgi:hypothetical protein
MEPETTCTINNTPEKGKLYMAMELSQKEWKLGFSVGPGQAPRLRKLARPTRCTQPPPPFGLPHFHPAKNHGAGELKIGEDVIRESGGHF